MIGFVKYMLFLAVMLSQLLAAGAEKQAARLSLVTMEAREWKTERTAPQKLKTKLPAAYDYRKEGRMSAVKNQGPYGTCWAFAALTALESSQLPEERLTLSPDHMTNQNFYFRDQDEGGAYVIAMSYLAGWQGPVLEEMDPYGDGVSPSGLAPVKHIQEIRMPEAKDYEEIKEMVYRYGGVDTSIYMDFLRADGRSPSYNKETFSYGYFGEEKPNHEVVIIGWDDHYPADRFRKKPEGDGAFICQNSWGSDFGDEGVFYVSYYDSNIGGYNIAYTKAEESDNYDHLYQTDLCGWSGQIGYHTGSAYFANVYTALEAEELCAVGFYTVSRETEYEIYLVPEFTDINSLNDRTFVKSGYMEQAGFYTVSLPRTLPLEKGQRFAVVVKVSTDYSEFPIAVETVMENGMTPVDLTDGEGYISVQGVKWENTEERHQSNICLKAYTRR